MQILTSLLRRSEVIRAARSIQSLAEGFRARVPREAAQRAQNRGRNMHIAKLWHSVRVGTPVVLILLVGCSNGWEIKESKSKMTDKTKYVIKGTSSTTVTRPKNAFRAEEKIQPSLHFIVDDGSVQLVLNPGEFAKTERKQATMMMRFDERTAESYLVSELDQGALEFAKPVAVAKALRDSKKLLIEYPSIAGKMLFEFSTEGFDPALKKLCATHADVCRDSRQLATLTGS